MAKTEIEPGDLGSVYSYTIVIYPPKGFEEQAPYPLAIIDLDKGLRVEAQLTDFPTRKELWFVDGKEREVEVPNIKIGTKVEMVTRKLRADGETGIIVYGYKFRPLLQGS